MQLGFPIPGWGIAAAIALAAALAWWAYARPPVALKTWQRAALIALRLAVLLVLIFLLLRPVRTEPAPPGGVVALLVDGSRSMAIADVAETPRLERARAIVRDTLQPALTETAFGIETIDFDDSDLAGALDAVAERFREADVAGVVLLTDGVDTGAGDAVVAAARVGAPLHVVGIGAEEPGADLEVAGLTAGAALAPGSLIDLTATVVAQGEAAVPVTRAADPASVASRGELRLLEDGRLLEVRSLPATGSGTPVVERFRVSPDTDRPIVYTVEVTGEGADLVPGNNRRSVLVPPTAEERRILMIEGAPGYEHSFLKRTWQADPGLTVDAVVRKGQNDRGEQTFYVQGDTARSVALMGGYPFTRAHLFRYDAVVFANIEAEFFRPEQLDLTAAFVAERGGGLLLLGPATLRRGAYAGSAFESVLPAALVERIGLASVADIGGTERVRMIPTREGLGHPMLRLAATPGETGAAWDAAPPLGGSIRLGPIRPGAVVLAVAPPARGERTERPLIVAQRYGAGRSMIFAGRGAWRWRMLLPSDDRTYETWWGQAARWLTAGARGRVDVTARVQRSPGEADTPPAAPTLPSRPGNPEADDRRIDVRIDIRDEQFGPVPDAGVAVVVTDPAGNVQEMDALPADEPGQYAASVDAGAVDGVHLVEVTVTRDGATAEEHRAWVLAGGADPELADPWLHPARLERVALAGGGAYLDASAVAELPARVLDAAPPPARQLTRQIWHHPLMFLLVLALLGAEWTFRRIWGMR